MRYSLVLLSLLLASADLTAQNSESRGRLVALHGGAAYARVPAADFETVRTLGGQDLFSQINAQDHRAAFVGLVSHRVWSDRDDGPRIYATIGTSLDDPGAVFLLGGSVGVARALLTIGAATALVERGMDPVPDAVFRGSGDRTVYARVGRAREWGFFTALSFAILW
jgi:hypothetical protein